MGDILPKKKSVTRAGNTNYELICPKLAICGET